MEINIFTKPSFYAHTINGITILIAIILIFTNFSRLKKMDIYNIITLVISFGVLIGIHGLLHLGLETQYKYNLIEQYTYIMK